MITANREQPQGPQDRIVSVSSVIFMVDGGFAIGKGIAGTRPAPRT